jgi:hypothetical protein
VLEKIVALPESSKRKIFQSPELAELPPDPFPSPLEQQEEVQLPVTIGRYESKYVTLSQEIQRLQKQNSRLNSRIRDVQVKLRDSKVEEDRLRNALGLRELQRSRGTFRGTDSPM